jgi:signal transduction histidine kinase
MNAHALTGRRVLGAWGAPLILFVSYALAMVLLVASGIIDVRNDKNIEQSVDNVSTTLEAIEKLRTVGNTLFIAESSQRGYLLTGNDGYLAPYRAMKSVIDARLADADRVVSRTVEQRAAMARLRALASTKFAELDRGLEAYQRTALAGAVEVVGHSAELATMGEVRETILRMLTEESRLLAERRTAALRAYSLGLTRAVVATVIVGLALTAFYLLIHRFLRQRDRALLEVEAANAALEQRVQARTADLSLLSRHLIDVREQEKKDIARDLHDDFGSYLTAINMDVSRVRDKIAGANPELAQKLERTLGLLTSAIELKRRLISELRPSILDNLGLGAALEQYIDEWSRRTGIAATFDFDGLLESNDEGCTIAIFRVFQEALANVATHAKATRVASSAYRVADTIEFEVADNGIGLTDADRVKPGKHGLLGIRERVLAYHGTMEIATSPGGGTVVRGCMPCLFDDASARAATHPLQFA